MPFDALGQSRLGLGPCEGRLDVVKLHQRLHGRQVVDVDLQDLVTNGFEGRIVETTCLLENEEET